MHVGLFPAYNHYRCYNYISFIPPTKALLPHDYQADA